MKVKATFLLFVLTTTFSFTQSNYQDIVFLKNRVMTREVATEIDKLNEETYLGKSGNSLNKKSFKPGDKGIVEYGFGLGVGKYGEERMKLNFIYGYQINPYILIGAGIGLRYYLEKENSLFPVFANFRAGNINKRNSPYFSLLLGYSFFADPYIQGEGVIANPEIGIYFKVSENSTFNVGFGYEMQKIYSIDENSGAISLTIGISF